MAITLDGTTGITTPGLTNTGTETIVTLTTTGNTILGNASTDTLNVGNGGLIKDASSNLIITNPTSNPLNNGLHNLQLATSSGYVIDTGPAFGFYAAVPAISQWNIAIISARADGTSYGGYLQFTTTPSTGTPVERMRITSTGNVGIGTTSPTQTAANRTVLSVNGTTTAIVNLNAGGVNKSYFYFDGTNTNINSAAGNLTFQTDTANAITFNTNGTTEQARIDSAGLFKFNSGYGSVATAYGCRAWVNFNGTGTVAIRASGNVSSITDNGVGDYNVNFTTAMPDVNYSVFGMGMLNRRVQYASATFGTGVQSVGAVNILNTDSSTTATDDQCVNVCVFR